VQISVTALLFRNQSKMLTFAGKFSGCSEGKLNPCTGFSGVREEMLSSKSSTSRLTLSEVSTRPDEEELLMKFSSPRFWELLEKSSFGPPELLELEAVGMEEMLASMFTMLELSSMLLERLELADVMFPNMEKLARLLLEVLPMEKLVLVERLEMELLVKWFPSIAKLAAVPHFGWEEELASRSVKLERSPMLVLDMLPARAARALPRTVELTVNLFKDSVTSDMIGAFDIFDE